MMIEKTASNIALIPLKGTGDMAEKIQSYLKNAPDSTDCEIIELDLPRFATGDAKAVLSASVRGKDVYILVDVGNYSCTYEMFGNKNTMSPDEHYQNLVRAISAIGGKAARINVIMPLLYSTRQDRRALRESLDCAVALQHLESIGVENIMCFDVHDDRVQNATPFMGFDNLMPTYQTLKALCRNFPDLIFDEEHLVMVSPDFGGMNRNFKYANELSIDLGVFYKRRDLGEVKDGSNPILVHKYIGPDLKGKDVLIVDDLIASGESMLDSVIKAKEFGAKRVFVAVTYGFFYKGVKKFTEAYEKGLLEAVFITNASYRRDDVLNAPWYREVNLLKYMSFYIYSINAGLSISTIIDSHKKISDLLKTRGLEKSV